MKYFTLFALVLTACTYTTPDGRKYELETKCISGHYEVTDHEEMRKKVFSLQKTYEVVRWKDSAWICDKSKEGTIWIAKTAR